MESWEASYLAGIIDGEGSITLTRIHKNEHRRPCITIASTDRELLDYVSSLTGGLVLNKKNYNPVKHKDSFTLMIKKKDKVLELLQLTSKYLRVEKKKRRAKWILKNYNKVTPRNGKYNSELLKKKLMFEEKFFEI